MTSAAPRTNIGQPRVIGEVLDNGVSLAMTAAEHMVQIGVDIGGTFTDVVWWCRSVAPGRCMRRRSRASLASTAS